MTSTDPISVGVLSLHTSKETKAILNAVDAMGYAPKWLREENLSVSIDGDEVVLEPDVDIVANRLLLTNAEQPAEGLGLAAMVRPIKPMLNQPKSMLTAIHKFATATTLQSADIPVPDALLALDPDRLNSGRDRFGDRAVYKTAIGTHGGGTWQVTLDEPVNPQVGHRHSFLQQFIDFPEGKPHDLRVYVVDGEVIGGMYRYASDGEWRTNVALGGHVEDAGDALTTHLETLAIDATDAIGLDYAGVDLIQDSDGWMVLEVNPTAGFKGFFKATGTNPAPYIAQLAIERAGGTVSQEQVAELSEIFDDSIPACMPRKPRVRRRSEPAIIGYIEEVAVAGTSGSEVVYAKSDTGAGRTSIDTTIAAEIGAGPIQSLTRVKSGSQKRAKMRPVVDVVIGIGGERHTVAASIEDRSHMDYPVLLGRDILENYQVDIKRRADGEVESGDVEEEEEATTSS